MTNMTLPMNFETVRAEAPAPWSTTWHKGERCTVLDSQEMSESMTRVLFADGRIAIVKTRDLGLRASEVGAYLAKHGA